MGMKTAGGKFRNGQRRSFYETFMQARGCTVSLLTAVDRMRGRRNEYGARRIGRTSLYGGGGGERDACIVELRGEI